eukprot:symbB.v1.2.005388.t1/scaffold316.1/size230253/3
MLPGGGGVSQSRRALHGCLPPTFANRRLWRVSQQLWDLFTIDVSGKQSPLFGKQARHAANLQINQGRYVEALPFLGEALTVEASKDAVNIAELIELVGVMVNAQQRSPPETMAKMSSNHSALKRLQQNVKERGLDTSKDYAILCHKMSLLYLHEGQVDPDAVRTVSSWH